MFSLVSGTGTHRVWSVLPAASWVAQKMAVAVVCVCVCVSLPAVLTPFHIITLLPVAASQ